jgi:hypothetical protein
LEAVSIGHAENNASHGSDALHAVASTAALQLVNEQQQFK